MARMFDRHKSLCVLHPLPDEDVDALIEECQADLEREDYFKEKYGREPVDLKKYAKIIKVFNGDFGTNIRVPSQARRFIEEGKMLGLCPSELAATMELLADLAAEPVVDAVEGEPDNLDDLL